MTEVLLARSEKDFPWSAHYSVYSVLLNVFNVSYEYWHRFNAFIELLELGNTFMQLALVAIVSSRKI